MEIKREQREIIAHNEGNIIVSASAGSGKTFVMIQRLIRLIVEKKADVDEILTVTFTDASARDMKDKLKKALIKVINGDGLIKADKERLIEQLNEIPLADISTIDSFCLRLLKRYFYVVGISHDFTVANDEDKITLKNLALKNVFNDYYDKKDEAFLRLLDKYREGRNDNALREMVKTAYSYTEAEEDPNNLLEKTVSAFTEDGVKNVEKEYLKTVKKNIGFCLDKMRLILKDVKEDAFPKTYKKIADTIDEAGKILEAKDVYSLSEIEIKYPILSIAKEEQTEIISSAVNKLKVVKDEIKKYLVKIGTQVGLKDLAQRKILSAKETAEKFAELVERFTKEYAKLKKEENILDFTDLERFALKVLEENEILSAVKSKYKYVCIDEYQDVNGLQESLFNKISDNNLFMVGDVKQSIYGFRGCRPEIFENKFNAMQNSMGNAKTLNYNYRSAENVINFINEVFSFSMTRDVYGFDYKKKAELKYGGRYAEEFKGDANIYMIKTERKEKKTEQARVYDIKQEVDGVFEEDNVSSLIKKIIESKLGTEYYDADAGKYRRITYKDIAVLLRDKKGKYPNRVAMGLRRKGVPVSANVKTSVLDFSEVEMLIGIIKYIDNARQDVPLVSALKSPLFNIDNADLLEIKRFYDNCKDKEKGDNFFLAYRYYLNNAETLLKEKLKAFEEKIERYRFLSDFTSSYGVLTKIIEENDYESYYLSTENGEEKVNRIRFFISAANFNGREINLHTFLKTIENRSELFIYNEGAEGDAVLVNTIHSSKGLEYPVVIVCGLEQEIKDFEDSDKILLSREYGFIPKSFDDEKKTTEENVIRGLIKEKNNITRIKEELRLFYVALTRAKCSLNLIFEGEEDERSEIFFGAKSFFDYVPKSLNVIYEDEASLSLYNKKHKLNQVVFVPDVKGRDKELAEKIKNSVDYRYPYIGDTLLPLKSSVTGVAEKGVFTIDTETVFNDETSSTDVGTIAHKFMEYLDFTRLEECNVQAQEMIKSGVMKKEEIALIDIDKIQSAIIKADLKSVVNKTLYKEKNFLYLLPSRSILKEGSDEKVLIQGIIDLLAIDEDSAIIIDYKYSGVDKKTLYKRYCKQLEIYGEAVEKVLGKKVIRKTIISLLTGETVDV